VKLLLAFGGGKRRDAEEGRRRSIRFRASLVVPIFLFLGIGKRARGWVGKRKRYRREGEEEGGEGKESKEVV